MGKILIVDNEEKFCKVIKAALALDNFSTSYQTSGEDALKYLQDVPVDIVVSDLRMDGLDGLQLLEKIKTQFPAVEVIIMTAYATQQIAVEALKKGAHDYLIKPFEMDELNLRIRRILEQQQIVAENQRLRRSHNETVILQGMVGKSKKMQEIYHLIKKGRENDATILVRGDSGTGKELVAKALHEGSSRSQKAFITVNCAALPENLLESELFGYEKGAFTGAVQRHIGKFEQADGGSIFLDEIGDMSLMLQAKLLRILQNKEFYRLGGNKKIIVDVRIITATHQNLEEMVEKGTLRNDLYYRLNVFPIYLPPLKERKEDIPALIHHFVEQSPARGIARKALAALMEYDWPGNVRELQNAIDRAAIICEDIIQRQDLPPHIQNDAAASSQRPSTTYLLPEEGIQLDEFEKRLISQALEKAGGNKTRAADLLGITRRRLYSMMERFGISLS